MLVYTVYCFVNVMGSHLQSHDIDERYIVFKKHYPHDIARTHCTPDSKFKVIHFLKCVRTFRLPASFILAVHFLYNFKPCCIRKCTCFRSRNLLPIFETICNTDF